MTRLCALALALLSSGRLWAAGTWVPLANQAPDNINSMLLLSDGRVMATAGAFAWYVLTPNSAGSYLNGTWSSIAPMNNSRLYFSSGVLTDGRVLVAGAEYGTGMSSAEVYDPLANTWTMTPAPGVEFLDSTSEILSNGSVMVSPVYPSTAGATLVYNPLSNAWSSGPKLAHGTNQDEASWVKLPDGSILTVDPFGTASERYIPGLNQWMGDSTVPVSLYGSIHVCGGGLLLPQGKVLYLGGSGHTAIYTPSGTTNQGSWTAGPDIPNTQGAANAPCAMMVNGRILCAVGPANTFNAPTSFYEYDPTTNAFTAVSAPDDWSSGTPPYYTRMLDLPDGTVLVSDSTQELYLYQPSGAPLANGRPAITSVTPNSDGTYALTGTQINGLSEGTSYNCDAELRSNYPLIRLTNAAGEVTYARTYNWSSTGVMTGTNLETTQFAMGALPGGTYSLVVVANGISSTPYSFITAAPQMTPATGFAAAGPVGGPFSVSSQTYTLTNALGGPINWSLANTSQWFTVSLTNGTLTAGGAAATVTVSLSPATAFLNPGNYAATMWVSNLTSGLGQPLYFSLQVAAANTPIAVKGFNENVVVPSSANGGDASAYTTETFDYLNEYDFYEAGLAATNAWGGNPTLEGLPVAGMFVSEFDHATTFQLGPYQGTNVLFMDTVDTAPSATLTLVSPTAFDSLAILAASSAGGGAGAFVLNFSDGSSSAPVAYNASDWLGGATGAGLTHFGAVFALPEYSEFYTDNPLGHSPSLFQTTVNLAALGLNLKPIISLTFSMPSNQTTSDLTDSGVFALSGTRFPSVVSGPTNLTVVVGGNASFGVTAGGSPPLRYQWLMNGTPLTNNARITGAQTNFLGVAAVTSSDAGSYQVVVLSPSGVVTSAVATLTVAPAPAFQHVSILGQSMTLTWTATMGCQYQLQSTGNLAAPWGNLGSPVSATNGTMAAMDSVTNAQRFYRLLLLTNGL